MLTIQENIDLRGKTTLKIGGTARFFAEITNKAECEEAAEFAAEKGIPLIMLGGGSNTIFADGTINALVVRIKADAVTLSSSARKASGEKPLDAAQSAALEESIVHVQAGKHLANLINELAEQNLDLSPLTGIPGTVGGALYGNAGQGFGGTWIDTYVREVEVFVDGEWKTLRKEECGFGYRTSGFKKMHTPIIWSCTLEIPSKPKETVKTEIDHLLQKRIETQPHVKTAGSCFLSISKEKPAWKLIDAAGLRGKRIGGIEVSTKHANFLINAENASFEDAKKLVEEIQKNVDEDLHVEMRFVEEDGSLGF